MTVGLDTNVLVYAHLPAFDVHQRVREHLLARLRGPSDTVVVTPLVLHEFVHIVTDERRFEPPVAMAEAIAVAGSYLRRANVTCVPVGEEAWSLASELLGRHRLGRQRIADTLLVAALLVSDVTRLVTCNPDDYRVFDEIEVIDPR